MKLNEDLAVAANHKAAENLDKDGLKSQRKRALVDSDATEETMPDALVPVLRRIYERRAQSGKLDAVADIASPLTWPPPTPQNVAVVAPYLNRAESSYSSTR